MSERAIRAHAGCTYMYCPDFNQCGAGCKHPRMGLVDGLQLEWIEFDELQGGPRRELIATHVETGRTVGVRVPAEWEEVEILNALEPDYRPALMVF